MRISDIYVQRAKHPHTIYVFSKRRDAEPTSFYILCAFVSLRSANYISLCKSNDFFAEKRMNYDFY